MANVLSLKAKIVENNTTQDVIADEIGINRSTFYRKMKSGGDQFTVREVRAITHVLRLNCDDVMRIFFM
jgi:hypothetical protein